MSPAFLEEVARARPDPGGGAAAAYAAALGLALLTKVVRLEGRRQAAGQDSFWQETAVRVEELRHAFNRLQDEDVLAYERLARARAEGSPEALAAAVRDAVAAPRAIMREAQKALRLILKAGRRCKAHLVSDLLVACELLAAALAGAHHIAGANLALVQEAAEEQQLSRELAQSLKTGDRLAAQVMAELKARGPGNFPPHGLK